MTVSASALHLKALRERAGITVRDMARAMGKTFSSYSHYEDRYKKPDLPADFALQAAEIFMARGLPPEEMIPLNRFIKYRQTLDLSELAAPPSSFRSAPRISSHHEIEIPRYDISAAAGDGVCFDDERIVEKVPFARPFLARLHHTGVHNLGLGIVSGHSMEDTLHNGQLIMFDRGQISPIDDKIYLIATGSGLIVKRVQILTSSDEMLLVSDNPLGGRQPERVRAADIRICARVIWAETIF